MRRDSPRRPRHCRIGADQGVGDILSPDDHVGGIEPEMGIARGVVVITMTVLITFDDRYAGGYRDDICPCDILDGSHQALFEIHAIDEYDVGILHQCDFPGGGLVRMGVLSQGHKDRHIGGIPGDFLYHIADDAGGSNHLQGTAGEVCRINVRDHHLPFMIMVIMIIVVVIIVLFDCVLGFRTAGSE
jgi:hypothetical protein